MWFNLDWTLAEVHKQILSKYLYMLKEYDSIAPTYEELLGLSSDPTQHEAPMREEHFDLEHTILPFMVNVVNPFKDKWGLESQCRNCGKKVSDCENCPLLPNYDVRLRDLLSVTCHKTKFQMNDYLLAQNQKFAG